MTALIERGVDVIAACTVLFECNPMHRAVVYGTAATVGVLLEADAPPTVRSGGDHDDTLQLLHALACDERPHAAEKARLLVAAGADIEARNSNGLTPLGEAAATGSPRVCDALLLLGANPAVLGEAARVGWDVRLTPLHLAAAHNDTALVKRLLRHAGVVDVDARTRPARPGHPDDERIMAGCTPLHIAALRGSVGSRGRRGALELLLDAGADAHALDDAGRAPLLRAVGMSMPEAVRVLLGRGPSAAELREARAHRRGLFTRCTRPVPA